MKVLHIINSMGTGGAEKLLVDALIKYRQKNIEAEVLLLNGEKTKLVELLLLENVPVQHLGTENSIYSLKNILKIRPYLEGYDIIHVHLFPASYFVVFSNFFLKHKKKLIFTEHNTTNKRRDIFILKPLERFVYRQFRSIVTISDAVHNELKRHLGEKFSNIVKIYNGINLEEINKAKPYDKNQLDHDDDDCIMIMVASFTQQKDQQTVIKSLQYLPDHVKLLLVGDGPLKNECEEISISLGLKKRITFLGLRTDVPRLLKTSDIVILSSNFEGLSLSSVEGLSSGNPFIASNVPGLAEVVENAGVLFPKGNAKKLAKEINHLIENEDYRNLIIKNCLNRANKFDINKMVDNYINVYQEITKK